METETIFRVASVFGATFLCETQIQLVFVASLQMIMLLITASTTPASVSGIKSLMHGVLLNYQVIVGKFSILCVRCAICYMRILIKKKLQSKVTLPTVLEIIMNVEAWKKRHIEKVIRDKIGVIICTNSAVKFLIKISILFIVRALKLFFMGAESFILCTFLNELVVSTCNYLFCFYVDLMGEKMKKLKLRVRKQASLNFNELEMEMSNLKTLSQRLYERFAICLFLNITYDFLAFIFHLYWTFIRIVHGPWSNATLFFIVQPAMNFSTLIITCHTCTREVS